MSLFADWLGEQGIEREMDVLHVSPAQFRRTPQVGTPRRPTWSSFATWLSVPARGARKDAAGGFSPALYAGGVRRKSVLVHAWLLVIDIDGQGDVDRVADEVSAYDAVVLETFSSTPEAPRCRLLMRLDQPVDGATYERTHLVVRTRLRTRLGVVPDDGAKDVSRLSYAPVRPPGSGYRFRRTSGLALSCARVLAAQPPPPARAVPRLVPAEHADAYRRGALRRAADAIVAAHEGGRHEAVNREAYALARLGLTLDEVTGALLPAAVAAMGEPRRREAERTIADGYRARNGAAA